MGSRSRDHALSAQDYKSHVTSRQSVTQLSPLIDALVRPLKPAFNHSLLAVLIATLIHRPLENSLRSNKTHSIKNLGRAAMAAPTEPKVTPFQSRVYEHLRQIPSGRVSTYALLARALDSSPRAVGGALRRNPYAPEVPCHRIVQADGVSGPLRASNPLPCELELTGFPVHWRLHG